ncbi:hypothetical protein ACF1AJ_20205 [Leifsonia sp. NPDC014704]|uniref:hypothetical protein n=1 Tax=Leifsonia sp. NPDC014704 TaxID=3364123 RepID=UPI000EB277D6
MQRSILSSLKALQEDTPPLFWYEKHALGVGTSASEGSSFRRAALSLEKLRLIDVLHAHRQSQRLSKYWRYRGNRRTDEDDTYQGPRTLLLVRLPPTDEDREARLQVEESLARALRSRQSAWSTRYVSWYFEQPIGVWNDEFLVDEDPEDSEDFIELSRLLSMPASVTGN